MDLGGRTLLPSKHLTTNQGSKDSSIANIIIDTTKKGESEILQNPSEPAIHNQLNDSKSNF